MLSHVHIGVRDFDCAYKFYAAVLPILGWKLRFSEPGRPWAGWQPVGADRPLFLIGKPFDGDEANPGNGNMTALLSPTRDAVNAFYDAALKNGASSEGKPGLRPEYHANYYGAYVRDPEGNKLCACCHNPEVES